jgi:hypothetical protein
VVDAVYYEVALEVDRRFTFEQTECLLGVSANIKANGQCERRRDCAVDEHPPSVEWTIYGDGQPIASGTSGSDNCGEYGEAIDSNMGGTLLKPFVSYMVRARVEGATPKLLMTKPRLVVRENGMAMESGAALSWVAWGLSVVFVGLGARSLFRAFRRNRAAV